VLGCDLVVAAGKEATGVMAPGRTVALLNTDETITADFIRDRDFRIPRERLVRRIADKLAAGSADTGDAADWLRTVDATRVAEDLLGDSIAANLLMVGYAFQLGLVPVSKEAVQEAIRLNGAAIDMNRRAFALGRLAAYNPSGLAALSRDTAGPPGALDHRRLSASVRETVERRRAFLVEYQDEAYAKRYVRSVERIRTAERTATGREGPLTEHAARGLFKLMAYKDEYEVARLHGGDVFRQQLAETFETWRHLRFHLAPPLLARRDPNTGEPRKSAFGPWVLRVFRFLAPCKRLRGTPFDPFGYTAERRAERQLIDQYERLIEEVATKLRPDNVEAAVALARLGEDVRGYGHVKTAAMKKFEQERARLAPQLDREPSLLQAAE
jgi:indolepyruvate ferredoxin oxidoreductase